MQRRYDLRGTLGTGGLVRVYRARDTALDREVALKALLPHLAEDPQIQRQFVAAARAIAGLRHPNIAMVYDVGVADDGPYFTTELIDGRTLADVIADGRPMSLAQTTSILRGLRSAVDRLHAAGLVHRDIKPSNVMVETSGRVLLMDFGVGRGIDRIQGSRGGAMLGTPATMAPEQIRGEAGPAADIYALGVLAYELLAGRPPFTGDGAAVLSAHVNDQPPPLRDLAPGLPDGVYTAVHTALAKDPGDRPPSAGAFYEALAGASAAAPTMPMAAPHRAAPVAPPTPAPVDERPPPSGVAPTMPLARPITTGASAPPAPATAATPPPGRPPRASTPPPPPPRPSRRPPVAAAIAAVAIAAGVAVGALWYANRGDDQTRSSAPGAAPTAAVAASAGTPASVSTAAVPQAVSSPVPAITVTASDNAFQPTAVEIGAGRPATVTLVNQGAAIHNWRVANVKDSGGKDVITQLLPAGRADTITFIIEQPGTYDFLCDVHPAEMRGRLIVR